MIEFFAAAGGLFAMLTFVHFFADWLFQTQHEATRKHKDWKVRAWHCLVYTAFFIPVVLALAPTAWALGGSLAILWVSHFVIDTYIPVFLWAKYMRKISDLNPTGRKFNDTMLKDLTVGQEEFARLWKLPVYPILFIAVDQIFHLAFLWPVVFLILL